MVSVSEKGFKGNGPRCCNGKRLIVAGMHAQSLLPENFYLKVLSGVFCVLVMSIIPGVIVLLISLQYMFFEITTKEYRQCFSRYKGIRCQPRPKRKKEIENHMKWYK